MTSSHARAAVTSLTAALVLAACSGASPDAVRTTPSPSPSPAPISAAESTAFQQGDLAAIARARADSVRHPYTEADIHFMSAMIGHHAQAIVMARMAPTHGASPTVQTLASRIINAQRDEIATMQRWLRDRRQPVPQVSPAGTTTMMHGAHEMHGAAHEMLMPGMLTAEQMRQLDEARGAEFDRLFLSDMIQHHQGAVAMVKELFGSYGAGQDELVFKLASDVNVDQITEIARMQKMLATLLFESDSL